MRQQGVSVIPNIKERLAAQGLELVRDRSTNVQHIAGADGKARCNSRYNVGPARLITLEHPFVIEMHCTRCHKYLTKLDGMEA